MSSMYLSKATYFSNLNIQLDYVVVIFTHEGCEYVSAAPKQWLFEENFRTMCMWPRNKAIERKAIKLNMKPETDWINYTVQVVGYYATLSEALAMEKKKQNSSSSEAEVARDEGKRKIIKSRKYRDDSISPPPTINTETYIEPNLTIATATVCSEDKRNSTTCNVAAAEACSNGNTESDRTNSNYVFPSARDIIEADVVLEEDLDLLMLNKGSVDEIQRTLSDVNTVHCGCKSDEIMSELRQIKACVNFTMRKVEAIELQLNKLNLPSEPNPTLLPNFPLTELAQIKDLEDKLSDENTWKELFNILRHTGGSKERDCVNRCLEKIFSDYLGQYCSWTGKKNNFKLSSLKLMTILKLAARETFTNLTDESFERHVMNWFQHAGTRLKRQN